MLRAYNQQVRLGGLSLVAAAPMPVGTAIYLPDRPCKMHMIIGWKPGRNNQQGVEARNFVAILRPFGKKRGGSADIEVGFGWLRQFEDDCSEPRWRRPDEDFHPRTRADYDHLAVSEMCALHRQMRQSDGTLEDWDRQPGHYYVSAINKDRQFLLAGPFPDHLTALKLVSTVRRRAEEIDPGAVWAAYGTARMPIDSEPYHPPYHNLLTEQPPAVEHAAPRRRRARTPARIAA